MRRTSTLPLLLSLILAARGAAQEPIPIEYTTGLIGEICATLREHYVYPDVAEAICDTLHRAAPSGRYAAAADLGTLTGLLTEDLRSANGDQHLRVQPYPRPVAAAPAAPDPIAASMRFIQRHKEGNFGITRVERLAGNVGYLQITSFRPMPNPEAERIVRGAMDLLATADALIIDLRRNGGGHLTMLEFFSSYFFDRATQLSSRFERQSSSWTESWTLDGFDDRRFVDMPLFILTSERTISAPEVFTYDLQAVERATVVGEVTAGAVNSGRFFTVRDSLQLLIATGYARNPTTGTHVEGRGVQPDVVVDAEAALDTCLALAGAAAEAHRSTRHALVEASIEEFHGQMAEVEALAAHDVPAARRRVEQVVRAWYEREFMNPYLLLDLGDQYRQEGRFALAIMVLEQGLRYYLGTYETFAFYRYLADSYVGLGDTANAIRYLARYLELFPSDTAVVARIRELGDSAPGP